MQKILRRPTSERKVVNIPFCPCYGARRPQHSLEMCLQVFHDLWHVFRQHALRPGYQVDHILERPPGLRRIAISRTSIGIHTKIVKPRRTLFKITKQHEETGSTREPHCNHPRLL